MRSERSFETTASVEIPDHLIDQVIGQPQAVDVIKKAARQQRHVLLVGEPGTGKSMLGKALAEELANEQAKDVLVKANGDLPYQPLIETVPAGRGEELVKHQRQQTRKSLITPRTLFLGLITLVALAAPWWAMIRWTAVYDNPIVGALMFGAFLIAGLAAVVMALLFTAGDQDSSHPERPTVRVLVDRSREPTPFYDGSGAHAGALLGDVLHDPYQSGGLGTPPHERVVAGLIHKADGGVLFIDEIATLETSTQQKMLTALQEGVFAITGQSETSAGAMVRTDPVPCRFLLVAAGNLDSLKKMHPALRSRIQGYGYEIFMNESMPDTPENRRQLMRFVAQEVQRDGRIPHFTREATVQVIQAARQRSPQAGHLTLRLRELGGLVRAAGDIAVSKQADLVQPQHVIEAVPLVETVEEQMDPSSIS